MLSIIWVAMITGLAAALHFCTSIFCASGTSSIGISTPRSPRATIRPSVALMISSMFLSASGFSILAIIRMFLPFDSMIFRKL